MSKQISGNTYYGEIAENYIKERVKWKSWQAEQLIVKELLTEIPDKTNVLDLPFGTGRFVDLYLAKDMKVYGLEISNDMISVAKKVLGKYFSCCEVTVGDATKKLPYQDNFFDVIICFKFLKYFPYNIAKAILHEFNRVSSSKVIVQMKALKKSEPPEGEIEGLKKIGANLYEEDIVKLFNETGFRVVNKIKIDLEKKNSCNKHKEVNYKIIKNLVWVRSIVLDYLKIILRKKKKKKNTERIVYVLKKNSA